MKSYILYKDKSILGFKRLLNSGGDIFDKYRPLAVSFIRYAGNELDKNFALYDEDLGGIDTINLEDIFHKKSKWLVSNIAFRNLRDYLSSLEDRITEFEGGKEDNLKVLVGVLFLRLVVVTKIVDTYLATVSNIKSSGLTPIENLSGIGIGKTTLKYLDIFEELQGKTIDDWLSMSLDFATANYFYSSAKRVLSILVKD